MKEAFSGFDWEIKPRPPKKEPSESEKAAAASEKAIQAYVSISQHIKRYDLDMSKSKQQRWCEMLREQWAKLTPEERLEAKRRLGER
jgi:hypothetical protein